MTKPDGGGTVVIDYQTFCKIHDCHHRQGLTIAQTARSLGLHRSTVAIWWRERTLHGDAASRVPANLIRSSRASRACLTAIPTALSRFFSGYARKDILAASASC